MHTFKGHTGAISSIAFSADGRRIVSSSADKTVRLWDNTTGKSIHVLNHPGLVRRAVISRDGKHIVSGCDDKIVRLWDGLTGRLIRTFAGHTSVVHSVDISTDGERILSSDADGTIRIWDVSSGTIWATLIGHVRAVRRAVFSPDGLRIASAGADRTARVWNALSGKLLRTYREHDGRVLDVAFNGDGTRIVSGSEDGTAHIWDVSGVRDVDGGETDFALQARDIIGLAFSEDGRRVVNVRSVGSRPELRMHSDDGVSGETIRSVPAKRLPIGTAVSPDGKYMIQSSGGQKWIVDAKSGAALRKLTYYQNGRLVFSPDGRWIVGWASSKGSLLDVQTGKRVREFKTTSDVKGLVFSPDGKQIAAVGGLLIPIWDVQSGKLLKKLVGHTQTVGSLAYTPDGKQIVSGARHNGVARGGAIRFWDVETGKTVRIFDDFAESVESLAISPDGKRIATAGRRRIQILNAETGETAIEFGCRDVERVTFSPDGKQLICQGKQFPLRSVYVWGASGKWAGQPPLSYAVVEPDAIDLANTQDATVERLLAPRFRGGRPAVEIDRDAPDKPVTGLRVVDSRFDDERMVELKNLPYLRELALNDTQITNSGLVFARGLTKLESLDLSRTRVTEAGFQHFTKLANLRRLTMRDTNLKQLALVRNWPRLEHLSLGGNLFGDNELIHLRKLNELKHLSLARTRITDDGLVHLKTLTNLQTLVLNRTAVTDAGLKHLKGLTNLKILGIDGTKITDDAVAQLQQSLPLVSTNSPVPLEPGISAEQAKNFIRLHRGSVTNTGTTTSVSFGNWPLHPSMTLYLANLPGLRSMRLVRAPLTDADFNYIGCLTSLRSLHFTDIPLTERRMQHIGKLTRLENLTLTKSGVTDGGAKSLQNLAELQILKLDETKIADAGVAHLAQLPKLRDLDVSKTDITDVGMAHLSNLKSLTQLNLAGSKKITIKGVLQLHAALPSCRMNGAPSDPEEGKIRKALSRLGAKMDGRYVIQVVTLSGGDVPDAALKEVAKLEHVEKIYLTNTKVTDAGLALLRGSSRLKILNLGGTPVTDAGLVHLKGLKNLTLLTLVDTKVTDAGLINLSQLKNLRALDVRRTKVTPEGLKKLYRTLPALAAFDASRTIRRLGGFARVMPEGHLIASFRHRKIADSDMPKLGSLSSIRFLDLSQTTVTDKGLTHLEMLASLRAIVLLESKVTEKGVRRLQAALPKAKILWWSDTKVLIEDSQKLENALAACTAACKYNPFAGDFYLRQWVAPFIADRSYHVAIPIVKRIQQTKPTDARNWFALANIYRAVGDVKAYRDLCDKMIAEHLGKSASPIISRHIAWCCKLGVINPKQRAALLVQLRKDAARYPRDRRWQEELAAALYRAGKYAESDKIFAKLVADERQRRVKPVHKLFWLSMTQYQLGRKEEARKEFREAAINAKKLLKRRITWYSRLELRLLQEEADRLVFPPIRATKPK